ncbi:MAG TPA: YrdB family protein [Anaerolineales bacterium]|nr:YrdB family protein [Anaerolineales bacterium]
MSQNPINLALRFFLELSALYAIGYWGWQQPSGFTRWLLAIGLPVLAAFLWGAFRAAEPHHAGKGLMIIPGQLRILLEAVFFFGAVWALSAAGQPRWAWIFGGVVIFHYLISYDRVFDLLGNSS